MDWESMKEEGLTEDQEMLLAAFENYGVKDYIVVEKGDVKIAITGVFGEDSLDCVPNCPLKFNSLYCLLTCKCGKLCYNTSYVLNLTRREKHVSHLFLGLDYFQWKSYY